jgi:hypothetical protein
MKLLSAFFSPVKFSAVKNCGMKKAGSKICIIMGVLLLTITFMSCKSFDTKFKSEQDTILYLVRNDAVGSYLDKVHFYLNGQKVAEVKRDSYVALHLKPGKYSAHWKTYSSGGKVLFDSDYGSAVFKPGVAYGSAVNYTFGWHAPFSPFDENIQGAMRRGVYLQEEIDLRKKIKPQ